MKRFLFLIPAMALLALGGCGTTKTPVTPQQGTGTTTLSGQQNLSGGKEYTVNLSDKEPSLFFPLNKGDTITLIVQSPTPKIVIRVSQIISPDGTADGPFSQNTVFDVPEKGMYNFIIKPNLMASEDPYTGEVKVYVSIRAAK